MIPANYTYDTFADYLKDEVLLDTAPELGWLDYTSQISQYKTVRIQGTPGHSGDSPIIAMADKLKLAGDGQILIESSSSNTTHPVVMADVFNVPNFIPAGTKITIAGTVRTTAADFNVTDTAITFTGAFAVSGNTIGYYYAAPVRNRNIIYTAIIDETLMKLGESDITVFDNDADLFKLRLYGRRECWRFAMQTLASDYNYSQSYRRETYLHCKQLFEDEDNRLQQYFSEVFVTGAPVSFTKLSTTSDRVKVRW